MPPIVFPDGVRPTPAQVSALTRTRTIGGGGADTGTFTADSSPTLTEVNGLIDAAVAATLNRLPPAVDQEFYPQIQHLAALYTVVLIEGSYHREQIAGGNSMTLWRDLFTEGLASLLQQMSARDGVGPQFGSLVLSSPTRTSYETPFDPLAWIPPVP